MHQIGLTKDGAGLALRIDRLERLFQAFPFDPANPEALREPGIDVVADQVSDDGVAAGAQLTVTVTAQALAATEAEQSTLAVQKYCVQAAQNLRRDVARIRRNGLSGLKGGIPTLAVALALSALVEQFAPFPQAINRLFSEGLVVLGWVVLWHPLEMLLYAWRAPIRLAKAYERVAKMPLVLRSE